MYFRSGLLRTLVCLTLAALACLVGVKIHADRLADQKLKAVTAKISHQANFSWQGVDVRLLSPDLVVHSVALRLKNGCHAEIDRLIVDDYNARSPLPNAAVIRIQGLRFPVDKANFGLRAAQIREFGYQSIDADLELDVTYDSDDHSLIINSLKFIANNLGEMRLCIVLDNFFPEQLSNMIVETLLIRKAEFDYRDGSLLRRLTLLARQNEKDFIDFFVRGLEHDMAAARKAFNEPAIRSIGALKTFLEDPQNLRVKMTLRQPLSIARILSTKKISDLLRLIDCRFSTE